MGKWIHRLTNIDKISRTAICSSCGPVKVTYKGESGGRFRCYYSSKYGSINGVTTKKPKLCEICNREKPLLFDHDHNTGAFRGWLCKRCNTLLGSIDDDTTILRKMISYIEKE